MKMKKIITGVLSIMLIVALINPSMVKAEESDIKSENYNVVSNITSLNKNHNNTVSVPFSRTRTVGRNTVDYTTAGGHQVEITGSGVYVDGSYVDLNWNFSYNIFYTRTQNFRITSSTAVDASTYQNGTFKDGQNMNLSSDCIRVKINNFTMSYYCSSPYKSWSKSFGANAWTYFYIDASTGKTIGTDANYYHTNMGITNTFNKF